MSLAPLAHQIRKRLHLSKTLEDAATETVIVSEAESALRSKAAYLPGQLDRVKGVQSETNMKLEMDRISETTVHHMATTAFRLRHCALIGGALYCNGARHQMLKDRPSFFASLDVEIDAAAFVGTPASDVYFGHFLCDDSATTVLAEGFADAYRPLSRHHSNWSHARDYYKMMSINLRQTGDAWVEDAWIFRDFGMTQSRRKRFETLRQRLRAKSSVSGAEGVYLMRGTSGVPRVLRNEISIAESLGSRGFEIVNPEHETAETLVRKIVGAQVVIGVEGSGMAHAFMSLADQGALLTIQPPYRFNNIYKEFTDMMGMGYGFVVAEGDDKGFEADLDDILRTVDLMM